MLNIIKKFFRNIVPKEDKKFTVSNVDLGKDEKIVDSCVGPIRSKIGGHDLDDNAEPKEPVLEALDPVVPEKASQPAKKKPGRPKGSVTKKNANAKSPDVKSAAKKTPSKKTPAKKTPSKK